MNVRFPAPGGHARGDSWRSARGGRLNEDIPAHGFFNFEFVAGSLAELERQQPFDYMTAIFQYNFVRGRGIGRIGIRGNLLHMDLSESDDNVSKLILVQDFEYENNTVFESGGQGVSLMYLNEIWPSDRSIVGWNAAASWMVLGGVKSDLAFLADVEGIRERFREYDFGIGPGLRGGVTRSRDGRRVIEASYWLRYLKTLNGAILDGSGSDHIIQTARLRAIAPVTWRGFSAGAEAEFFDRRSDFDVDDIGRVHQRTYSYQLFLSWNPRRG